MALPNRLASLVACALLLATIVVAHPPTVLGADEPICATKPELCVQLTLRLSGYLTGDAAADANQATPSLTCHHEASGTATTCSGMVGTVGGTRTVNVAAFMSNPAGATICINTQCGAGSQNRDVTLTLGGRNPAVAISFNPTNGHTVTVSRGGSGTGTVTSDKGGISCGSACTWMYADSTLVVLTATPTGGSTFAGWSDGGTCMGQDATCHLLTGVDVTTQALFNAPATPPPTAPATPVPTKTPAPTKTPTPSTATPTATPSAGHTAVPGTPAPGGPTPDPNATLDPAVTGDPNGPTTDPNAAPVPTPFKITTDDPNRTEIPLNALPSGQPTKPASDSGGGPPFVLIGLIVLLGVVVGGGVFWWARRRGPAPG